MQVILYYLSHTLRNLFRRMLSTKRGYMGLIFLGCMMLLMVYSVRTRKMRDDYVVEQNIVEVQDEKEEMMKQICVVGNGIIFVVFAIEILTSVNKANGIFHMADVNLLFPAPIKPQTILLFRIVNKMGSSLLATFYMLYQIPNMMNSLDLSLIICFGILLVYFLVLVLSTLLGVLTYCMAQEHKMFRVTIRPITIVLLAVLAYSYVRQTLILHNAWWPALSKLLYSKWFRNVPLIGWLGGLLEALLRMNIRNIILYGLLLMLGMIVIVLIIYKTKVDYYEDALATAQTAEEMINASKEGRVIRKERKVKREFDAVIGRGCGANAFFYKAISVHRHFSRFGIFSSVGITYDIVCIGVALFTIVSKISIDPIIFFIVVFIVAWIMTSTSNLSMETNLNFIFLVPDHAFKKVFYCALSDVYTFLLDLLPPYIIASFLMKYDLIVTISSLLSILAFMFAIVQLAAFFDLLLPSIIAVQIKMLIVFFLKTITFLPMLIIIIISYYYGYLNLGFMLFTIATALFGMIFMYLCANLLHKGRK